MRVRARAVCAGALLTCGWLAAVALAAPGGVSRNVRPGTNFGAERPRVLAASSLTEVLPAIEPDALYAFGGSNQLAEQIRRGARFDVFFSASPKHTQRLYRERLVKRPVTFATNELVVIVPRANPARIEALEDLTRREKVRLVVAGPDVPIGAYTREVLKRAGLLGVLRHAVSIESDVKGIVGKVALGEADAGFVYATDVPPVRARVRVVRIPSRVQPEVRYELAVASTPSDLQAAKELIAKVRGPRGRAALRTAGFGTP